MSGLLLSHVRGGADAGDLNTAHSHANGQGCPQIQESSIHIYRLGFSALDSPLPTLLMSHATGWLLVLSRMQMTLDRGVSSPCSHPCRYSYYHRHQTPGNNCTCPKSWCHRNTVNTKYVADRRRRTLIRLTNNFRTYRFASAGHKYDIYYIIDIMNIQSLNIYSPNRDLHLPQVTGDGLIGI